MKQRFIQFNTAKVLSGGVLKSSQLDNHLDLTGALTLVQHHTKRHCFPTKTPSNVFLLAFCLGICNRVPLIRMNVGLQA